MSRRVQIKGVRKRELSHEELGYLLFLMGKQSLREKREREAEAKTKRQRKRERCHER